MGKKEAPVPKETSGIKLSTLEDLITLNLSTIEEVVTGEIDNRKAQLIFTGSRTVTSSLKLGIEAMKLGVGQIAGVRVGFSKVLPEKK